MCQDQATQPRRWQRLHWLWLVRLLAPLGALAVDGWPALVGAVIVQEGGLWLVARLMKASQRTFATRLFVSAFALRLAIVLPTHYVAALGNGNGALYRDDYTSDLVGEWLLRIARGDGGVSIFAGHQYLLGSIYSYFLMGVFAVFGYSPLLPKLINIALASLCAVLVFDIARKAFSWRAAVVASVAAAILPSLIVWSVATLKETLVLFAALVALWLVQFLATADRRNARVADALVLLLAMVLLLLDLRGATAFILVAMVGLIYASKAHVRLRPWQTGLASVLVLGLLVGGLVAYRGRTSTRPLTAAFEDIALQIRHRRAQEAAGAASQLRPQSDTLSATGGELPASEAASDAAPFSFVGDVIDPLGYALLAPAPWQAQSAAELAASAEMPVWYVLLAASFLAWRRVSGSPGSRLFVTCLTVYGIANWLILAAVEGNLGNLLRHRLMLDPVLLILGAAGLEQLWLRWRPVLRVRARAAATAP